MNNLVPADSTYKVALPHLQITATTVSSNDGEKIFALTYMQMCQLHFSEYKSQCLAGLLPTDIN